MNILVTGGAGYIGSHTVKILVNNGHNVIILDNFYTGKKDIVNPSAKLYEGDIRDSKILDSIFASESIDVVINFAGLIKVDESFEIPNEYFDVNTNGVKTLIDSMKKYDVKKIIFSSTAAVYSVENDLPITETSKIDPISPYGFTKYASEKLIEYSNLDYCIFRYFNVAGADKDLEVGNQNPAVQSVVPMITKSLVNDVTFQINGTDYEETPDGSCIRDFVHVSDLAYAHFLAAEKISNSSLKEIINLGTNKGYSILETVQLTKKLYPQFQFAINERRQGDIIMSICSNEKAKEILNWNPEMDLESMIVTDYLWRKKYFN